MMTGCSLPTKLRIPAPEWPREVPVHLYPDLLLHPLARREPLDGLGPKWTELCRADPVAWVGDASDPLTNGIVETELGAMVLASGCLDDVARAYPIW
jgi:hypothetical protein